MQKRVKLNLQTGCHEVQGRNADYPTIRIGDKTIQAHRAAYLLYIGPIPKGRMVLHKCDNAKCINPAHLYAGTHKDNIVDMLNPGRWGVKSVKTVDDGGKSLEHDRQPYMRKGVVQQRAPLRAPRTASALSPGQDHATAKLTDEQIYEIRASAERGTVLAKRYGVAQGTISKIRNRYLWCHLP